MLARIEHHPNGLRFWLLGWRCHHWHAGLALVAVGGRLIYQDRADLPGRH